MNKASGGDGILAQLFQILKMLLKCCTQYVSKFGKFNNGHRTGKGQFSFQYQERHAKECSSYHAVALISHASKVKLKIHQARLQQYVN